MFCDILIYDNKEMSSKEFIEMYDNIVNWLLNIPIVAIIILVVVVLMAIPQIRDGIKTILSMLKKKEEFVYEVDNEKITFEEILKRCSKGSLVAGGRF